MTAEPTPELFTLAAHIAAHLFRVYPGWLDGNELVSLVAGEVPDVSVVKFRDALTLSGELGWTMGGETGVEYIATGPIRWYVDGVQHYEPFDLSEDDPEEWR